MRGDSSMKFDEMHAADGSARGAYRQYDEWLGAQELSWLRRQSDEAERFFRRTGITFNVYGANDGEERLIPFDVIPRIVTAAEWRKLERGIASGCARSTPSFTTSTIARKSSAPVGCPSR